MFKPQNRIIIVDNRTDHLDQLSKPFYDNGIGCKTFQFDPFYDNPLTGVRVAFFDINLFDRQVTNNNSQIFADLANAIPLYISKENGPFALIFWTSLPDVISDFKRYIKERTLDLPKPFLVEAIDKHAFGDSGSDLSDKLRLILNDQTLELLFDFENNASDSATRTINQIFEIIPTSDNWGENQNFLENFEKIFSKIASSTLGFSHAKQKTDKAVYEGLLPILSHHILSLNNSDKWKRYLRSLNNASSLSDLAIIDKSVQRKMNAVFHIESANQNKDQRGIVIELNKNDAALRQSFGIENIETCFNDLIPFNSNKTAKKRSVRHGATLVAIEISSACDFSNNKPRINKYVLGFKIEPIDVKDDLDKLRKSESSYHVANSDFHFKSNDFQIWLNFNFVFSAKSDDSRFGPALFIFKKEIMDMIGNRYANHISRIGITSF
jgi:hypothetical protein